MQFNEELSDHFGRFPIKVSRGFIAQQQAWFEDQRAGDCRPLALSTGKLRWEMVRSIRQPDAVKQLHRPTFNLLAGTAPNKCRQENILEDGALGQEVMVLKDKSNLGIPESCQLNLVQLKGVVTAKEDSP